VATILWGKDVAEAYDRSSAGMFDPAVLGPTVDLLAELAGSGPALELAAGTGRVALPLSQRGIEVAGIELSPHMAEQLRKKPGADAIDLTIGDMATARASRAGDFTLVYLVFNTIMNLTTQDEQVQVFENAASHLSPGGCFVVELIVPQLRRTTAEDPGWVFQLERGHVGVETFDDVVEQIAWSHHWMDIDGRLVHHAAPYRYVWPAELDLMARVAGLRLRDRWSGWDRAAFTSTSLGHVSVYEKPAEISGPA
jgi:SAM-dependent methyltransferase